MPTVQIEAQLTPDTWLEAVHQLNEAELSEFSRRVMALQAERRAYHLPQSETELLLKINEGLPPNLRQRYRELIETWT